MSDDIHFERRGRAGVVTLDRMDQLNAVTHDMVRRLEDALVAWEDDEQVEHVVLKSVPGRAFSVGGDIRALYEAKKKGEPDFRFFRDEYRLNARIRHFAKPYVSLIDGLVMGGGVGISINGSHRIGGRMAFAMPECGIGFFPDVGASYILSRMRGCLGMELGLTGRRLSTRECLATGIATHLVEPDEIDAVAERLEKEALDAVLKDCVRREDVTGLMEERQEGNGAFAREGVGEIMERLEDWGGSDGADIRRDLERKSPTSLMIAHEQITRGEGLSFADCMRMEFRIVSRVLEGHDFYEGIRAQIIDKDRDPKWDPASLEEIDPSEIARYFEPCGEELDLAGVAE